MNNRLLVSIGVGLGYVTFIFILLLGVLDVSWTDDGSPSLLFFVLNGAGLFVVASAPVFLLLRFGLVSPVGLLLLGVGLSVTDPFATGSFTIYFVNIYGWLPFIVIAGGLGALEFGIRSWSSIFPPRPVVRA